MNSERLTYRECRLIQGLHDGELDRDERERADALLERSTSARVYRAALEELEHAVKAAETSAWESARDGMPAAEKLVELAIGAPDPMEVDIEELAPLLERFHDGEADHAEVAFVQGLLREREDVADYLAALEEISGGVKALGGDLGADVDFSNFWDGIAAGLESEETPDTDEQTREPGEFRPGDHLVLIQRFFDDEVDERERQRVTAWIEQGHPEVIAYIEALEEVRLSVNAGIENAQEQVDFHHLWTGVSEKIDALEGGENVVSLDAARGERTSPDAKHTGGGSTRWFDEYRQAIYGAAAAVLLVGAALGLFRDQIFGPQEQVVVEKTVVIVDSVEYAPGSDVLVDSPMKPASMKKPDGQDSEEGSTVIWLFDSEGSPGEAGGTDNAEDTPAADGKDADAGKAEPKGDGDAGEGSLGQPM
ncbi:MAG: hypothetical protein ACQEVA_19240 [Myxococcota bacterium]